jgi:hypothetical protein
MGLDMYLSARRNLYKRGDEEIVSVIKAEQIKGMGDMEPKAILCSAMYWRKANAIHKWFVDNVQNGDDDCGEYEVYSGQLRELESLCLKVLAERGKATELLPPCEGFFYGSKEIDDYYWEYLQETADRIANLLSVEGADQWDFIYSSSW